MIYIFISWSCVLYFLSFSIVLKLRHFFIKILTLIPIIKTSFLTIKNVRFLCFLSYQIFYPHLLVRILSVILIFLSCKRLNPYIYAKT